MGVGEGVVGCQHSERRERADQVGEVPHVGRPLRVEENEVPCLVRRAPEGVSGVLGDEVDPSAKPGLRKALGGQLGACLIGVNAEYAPVRLLGRISEPDGRVAVGGADLQDSTAAARENEKREQLRGVRRLAPSPPRRRPALP
jgi:hypothetical protein